MSKLRKNTNKRLIAIAVVLLLAISIGYAALSTSLSINGTANIASSSWLIYFTNVQVTTGSVTATTAPTTSGTSTTSLTWVVSMDTPGQFYEYTVDVKNDGSIDAGDTVTLKVRVEFKTDVNPADLPGEATTITFTYTSNYVQADGNAKDRNRNLAIGDTVNYSTSMNGVTLDNWKVFYIDGDYTTLIYGDYLPNSAIDTTSSAFSNLTKANTYGIYANNNRIQLLDAMQTKSNWDSLLTGTINGETVNETRTSNVWAMGSPTLD